MQAAGRFESSQPGAHPEGAQDITRSGFAAGRQPLSPCQLLVRNAPSGLMKDHDALGIEGPQQLAQGPQASEARVIQVTDQVAPVMAASETRSRMWPRRSD